MELEQQQLDLEAMVCLSSMEVEVLELEEQDCELAIGPQETLLALQT